MTHAWEDTHVPEVYHIRSVIRNGESWGFPGHVCVGINPNLFNGRLMIKLTADYFITYEFTAYKHKVETYPTWWTEPKDLRFGKPGERVMLHIVPLSHLEVEDVTRRRGK